MLPKNYKFHLVNNAGVLLDFDGGNDLATIKVQPYNFSSAGALQYGSEVTVFTGSATLADGSSQAGTAQDNSSSLSIGLHCAALVQTTGAANGSIDVYYEYSTDEGITFPSDAADVDVETDLVYLGSISFAASGVHSINIEV